MNKIAEHKHSSLIIQIEAMNDKDFIGRVLVGNSCTPVGTYSTWSTKSFNISNNEPKEDPIVKQVTDKINQRSQVGIKKYKTTLAENNTDDFLTHLQEELFDASLYIEKLKEQKDNYFLLLGRYNELKASCERFDVQNAIDGLDKLGYIVGLKM